MISKYMRRHIQRRDAKIRSWVKTMTPPEVAKKVGLTPARVYQILAATPLQGQDRSLKDGQNKRSEQGKNGHSGRKGKGNGQSAG